MVNKDGLIQLWLWCAEMLGVFGKMLLTLTLIYNNISFPQRLTVSQVDITEKQHGRCALSALS